MHLKVAVLTAARTDPPDGEWVHTHSTAHPRAFAAFEASLGYTAALPPRTHAALEDAERQLFRHRPVHLSTPSTANSDRFVVVLANGVRIAADLHRWTSTLAGLTLDNSLVSVLTAGATVTAAALTAEFCVLATSAKQLVYVDLVPRRSSSVLEFSKKQPAPRRLDLPEVCTKIVLNLSGDLALAQCGTLLSLYRIQPDTSHRIQLHMHIQVKGVVRQCEWSCTNPGYMHLLLQLAEDAAQLYNATYECSLTEVAQRKLFAIPLQSQVVCMQRSSDDQCLLVGCQDGSLLLHYKASGDVARAPATEHPITALAWHPHGAVAVAAHQNGILRCFDLAMQPISVTTEAGQSSVALDLVRLLGYQAIVRHMRWMPVHETESSRLTAHNLVLVFDRGPLMVIRVELGVAPNGVWKARDIVALRLRADNAHAALAVAVRLANPLELYESAALVFHHLVRRANLDLAHELLDQVLPRFLSPDSPVHKSAHRLVHRLCHLFLVDSQFEKAFALAKRADSVSLFADVVTWAEQHGEMVVAKAALEQKRLLEAKRARGTAGGKTRSDLIDVSLTEPPGSAVINTAVRQHDFAALEKRPISDLSDRQRRALGIWYELKGMLTKAKELYASLPAQSAGWEEEESLQKVMHALAQPMSLHEELLQVKIVTAAP